MYDITALFLPCLPVIVFPRHINMYICLATVGFILLCKCLIKKKKNFLAKKELKYFILFFEVSGKFIIVKN